MLRRAARPVSKYEVAPTARADSIRTDNAYRSSSSGGGPVPSSG